MVLEGYIYTPIHAIAVKARGSDERLKGGQLDLFSTPSASRRWKNIRYHAAFLPQKNILWGEMAEEKQENQYDHPGVAVLP